jgi:hypothetical protein
MSPDQRHMARKPFGPGAHGVGEVRRVVDGLAGGDGEAAVSGLPEGGAGEDRVGLGGLVGVEGVVAAGGLVEEAEEEAFGRDRRIGAEEGDDGLDRAEAGRLREAAGLSARGARGARHGSGARRGGPARLAV